MTFIKDHIPDIEADEEDFEEEDSVPKLARKALRVVEKQDFGSSKPILTKEDEEEAEEIAEKEVERIQEKEMGE